MSSISDERLVSVDAKLSLSLRFGFGRDGARPSRFRAARSASAPYHCGDRGEALPAYLSSEA